MALIALPPELKLNVIDYLDPDSTLNFALTCRDHATLAKSTLREHGRLLSEWDIIDTTDGRTLLWRILKEVLIDPRQGWYTRELNLPATRQYNWTAGESLFQDHPKNGVGPSEEDMGLFIEAAKKLRHLCPEMEANNLQRRYRQSTKTPSQPRLTIDSIEDRIHAGFEDAIIVLLLYHLPYLTTIRQTLVGEEECLELALWHIASAYKDPAIAPMLPLQQLKTVAMIHNDTEGSISPDWACYYLSVPSLKTFAAQAMGNSPRREVQYSLFPEGAAPCSNVIELFFSASRFNVGGFAVILAAVKHLKKLTYDGGDSSVSESSSYQSQKVLEAVVTHAAHSLEELSLSQGYDDDYLDTELPGPRTVSLRDLQQLRMLNCEWSILRPETEEEDPQHDEPLEEGYYRKEDYEGIDSDFDVRTILPESIEELHLCGDVVYEEWERLS
ncbi:hypothetical protein G6011_10303 [Alternaria panax]|uniref:F-box domain-containing protein n=1 Tax=Alternaria panax TaxID=48097 RepID=A0AAD4IBK4_9PLEO|nr:hypothetical protein G6011_10303 [Alternaria panax]